jgi:hypothetical protein
VEEEKPGERPKWSITWLLRVQRVGRNRSPLPPQATAADRAAAGFSRLFPWAVLLLLLLEVGLLVWLGVLPR